jgi:hypothetical protein
MLGEDMVHLQGEDWVYTFGGWVSLQGKDWVHLQREDWAEDWVYLYGEGWVWRKWRKL